MHSNSNTVVPVASVLAVNECPLFHPVFLFVLRFDQIAEDKKWKEPSLVQFCLRRATTFVLRFAECRSLVVWSVLVSQLQAASKKGSIAVCHEQVNQTRTGH